MALGRLLLGLLIAASTLLAYYVRRNLHYWKMRGIPHDKPHPLYGNMKGVRKTRVLHELIERVYKKYKGSGPFCGFYFVQQPRVLVLDTALAKQILIKEFANFSDRGMYCNERDDPLTGHLVALDGVKWKQMRQKLSPTFTSGKMRFMFPTVVKVAEQFVSVFGELLEKGSDVEIKELLARFTTDVIGTCAFGIDCNSLRDPNAEFRVMGRSSFQRSRHGLLLIAFMFAFPEMARKLRMRAIPDDIHEFFMRIVRETVSEREQKKIRRNDFMDLLIELKNKQEIKLENGQVLRGLTLEEVAAQAFVFFLAGFETSSTTMAFALYELACHQDVQQRVREELNKALRKHELVLSYECLKELKYLQQVISETLRLHTIVSYLNRQALKDYVVPGHPKYVIERGTRVLIPATAFHHDPELYPEPMAFKPERFSPEMLAQRDSVEWLPFGDGPRNCIGMRFGLMQTRIGLAMLLLHFTFHTCPATPVPMKYDSKSILLSPLNGIKLRVERVGIPNSCQVELNNYNSTV